MRKIYTSMINNVKGSISGLVFALLFLLSVVLSGGTVWAASTTDSQKFSWPTFDRSAPLKREFTAVKHYNFTTRNFSPAVIVEQLAEPIENDKLLYPEQTVRSHISAMRAGDYDWWLSTMDTAAREKLQQADIAKNFIEKRKAQWAAVLKGASVTMERWIETGRYLIITVRLTSANSQSATGGGIEIPIVMSVQEGTWLVTANLKTDDPVYKFFNHPDLAEQDSVVIERTIR